MCLIDPGEAKHFAEQWSAAPPVCPMVQQIRGHSAGISPMIAL
jgi:hypothetical protein